MPVIVPDKLSDLDVCDLVTELITAAEKKHHPEVTIGIPFLFDDDAAGEEWG